MHDNPGNSSHIISDNNMGININISIASELNMNIDIMIDNMQDSFTKELNI